MTMTTTAFTPTTDTPSTNGTHRSVTPKSGYRMTGWRLDLLLWLANHAPIFKTGTRRDATVYAKILGRSDILSSHVNPAAALGRSLRAYENLGFVTLQCSDTTNQIEEVRMTEKGLEYAEARRRERNELRPTYLDTTSDTTSEASTSTTTVTPTPVPAISRVPTTDDVAQAIASLIEEEVEIRLAKRDGGTLDRIRTILHSGGSPLSMLAQIEALL